MKITILGLSITSSWGNGHATTFRGLVRELSKLGHEVLFLERDVSWYANNRDLPDPEYCRLALYKSFNELEEQWGGEVANADVVIVGSYVPDGVRVGDWALQTARGVVAFYDIDTPVTLGKLARKDYEYLHPRQIPRYDLYLSFTGGPTLDRLEKEFGSPCARALYCSFDPDLYYPEKQEMTWDLGYLGTYSDDRQPPLDKLMLEAARCWPEGKFVVAGPQYPKEIEWPKNVERVDHLPPKDHRAFYNSQRFTQNITRADMIKAGWAPSVRLFEAAACATPIISDYWDGLTELFRDGEEILISRSADDTLHYLHDLSEQERQQIGERARENVLQHHTAAKRAEELVGYIREVATPASEQPLAAT